MAKETIKSLRGMNDILDKHSDLFIYFCENASKIVKNYGFEYIKTPILEETALFKRSVGESSDIINKEMYQFIDKGKNDVCLRPEGTAGVVRSFIQNKFDKLGKVKRWYYYGPMFRYERPQKGRLRQFHQFGAEVFGVNSVYEDANIIIMLKDILEFFNIDFRLQLNSLGCQNKECMPKYKQTLIEYLHKIKSELCCDCVRRIKTNPIRVLDCKNEKCQSLLIDAPKITHNLCNSCDSDFEKLKEILDFNNVKYEINTNLVRGLDYYCKTAFEFLSDEIGAKNSIVGGGRYDRLVEFLGGKQTPGIGFGLGIDRVIELIKKDNLKEDIYYIGSLSENALNQAIKVANIKRKTNKTYIQYSPKSFSKHFKNAQKQKANIVVLIGDEELKNNTLYVKNIETKKEENIKLKDF